jgi:hypothetical protein
MTYKDISALTGISVAALKKRKERGQLPEPDLAPSQRSVLWVRHDYQRLDKEQP